MWKKKSGERKCVFRHWTSILFSESIELVMCFHEFSLRADKKTSKPEIERKRENENNERKKMLQLKCVCQVVHFFNNNDENNFLNGISQSNFTRRKRWIYKKLGLSPALDFRLLFMEGMTNNALILSKPPKKNRSGKTIKRTKRFLWLIKYVTVVFVMDRDQSARCSF